MSIAHKIRVAIAHGHKAYCNGLACMVGIAYSQCHADGSVTHGIDWFDVTEMDRKTFFESVLGY